VLRRWDTLKAHDHKDRNELLQKARYPTVRRGQSRCQSFNTANIPVLMKRQSQHQPRSGGDALDAMFDRLQAMGAADRHQPGASAKQDHIAQSSRNFTAACPGPFGDIAQDEFAALESIERLIGARAQDRRRRSWLPILRGRKGGPSALTTVLASNSE
jgi:hypothetical protein